MNRHGEMRRGTVGQITADMVSERVVAAFAFDRRLPRVVKPKAPGGSHPATFRDREEIAEVEEARRLVGIKDDEAPTIRPSQVEIAEMEVAFEWLYRLATLGSKLRTGADGECIREADPLNLEACIALRHWAARMAEPVKTLVALDCGRLGYAARETTQAQG